MDDRTLNRALLARQRLLERSHEPLVDLVEAIGALQGQAWSALPPGLASRSASFEPADLYAALDADELRWGIGLRGTLHLVSAREHPLYARAAGTDGWARALRRTTPEMDALRAELLEFCAQRRTSAEIAAFADARCGALPAEEVAAQRKLNWRPIYRWARLVRVPDGSFGPKAPADHRAADGRVPPLERATEAVALRHLGAFGPATAADVAQWMGHRAGAIGKLLDSLELERFGDRYDLPGAPRPDPDTDAPPRFLGAFDSSLLAYAPKARQRILPDALAGLVHSRANLQIKPVFLLDGFVAGIWSVEVKRKTATITLTGGPKRIPKALRAEGERLLGVLYPDAADRSVVRNA